VRRTPVGSSFTDGCREQPHRDFDELYTGGLSYLHALAFHTLGVTATSLRLVLFGWFLARLARDVGRRRPLRRSVVRREEHRPLLRRGHRAVSPFREQCCARAARDAAPARAPFYRGCVAAILCAMVGALLALVASMGPAAIVQFVLPSAMLAALVAWGEWRGVPGRDPERFATLLATLIPFGAGFAIPLLLFLVPFAASGSAFI
jgi:hypothetical protein